MNPLNFRWPCGTHAIIKTRNFRRFVGNFAPQLGFLKRKNQSELGTRRGAWRRWRWAWESVGMLRGNIFTVYHFLNCKENSRVSARERGGGSIIARRKSEKREGGNFSGDWGKGARFPESFAAETVAKLALNTTSQKYSGYYIRIITSAPSNWRAVKRGYDSSE